MQTCLIWRQPIVFAAISGFNVIIYLRFTKAGYISQASADVLTKCSSALSGFIER